MPRGSTKKKSKRGKNDAPALEEEVNNAATAAPRRSKRQKGAAQDEETINMDVDARDEGAELQGSSLKDQQTGSKKSTARGSRKRANTSDLPPAAPPKKPKAVAKNTAPASEKTTRGKSKGKQRDSSEDSVVVVETFSQLQVEGEGSAAEEVDGENESDSEDATDKEMPHVVTVSEDSADASEYEEGDEKFGGSDDEDEGDKEGRAVAAKKSSSSQAKAKGAGGTRKEKNTEVQMSIAVPTFVQDSDEEQASERQKRVHHATSARPSHKRVTTVMSDTESGEDEGDEPRVLQPTLPKRTNATPAGESGTTLSHQTKDLDVIHWQIKGGKRRKQKAKQVRHKLLTYKFPLTAVSQSAHPERFVVWSVIRLKAPEPTQDDAGTSKPPGGTTSAKPAVPTAAQVVVPTATQVVVPTTTQSSAPAPTQSVDLSTQPTFPTAKVAPTTHSAAALQAAHSTSDPGASREAIGAAAQGVDAQADALLTDAMETAGPRDVKPDVNALTLESHDGQWPAETDLLPATGALGNLGDQKAAVQPVLTQANTRELFIVMANNHFIPSDTGYRNELIREALIKAADVVGEEVVAARLRASKPYATRMASIPAARMSIMRGKIKEKTATSVAAEYNFAGFGGLDKLALGIAEITSHPTYTHIFPGDHTIRKYDKALPFCHSAIIASIRASHFVKRPYARLPKDTLKSSITTGIEAEELELPAPLIAFHAVATFASLKDWQNGTHNVLIFDTDADCLGSIRWAYEKHMTTLRNMRRNNPKGYHLITHYLYMKAAGLIVEDESTDPAAAGGEEGNPEVDMANIGLSLKLRHRIN
ncbi:hypothetical protein BV25DRAFT_1914157 [Artomyces pyxidatus]|uniref:Uncharacterized protein n=1 Tax=Artomyces pyxidatus TaxID=48021 RepID=A0ACB8T8B6_9AGAM|nr:hypothetical protein BV25DRAFT_1914157 [Artomyces pyxidatus]